MTQWLIPAALIVIAVVIAPDNPKQAARKAATKRRKAARCWQQPAHSRRGYNVDPAQIDAMEAQIRAACELGLALDNQVQDVQGELTEARHKVKQLKEWGNMDYKVQALTQQINKTEAKRARLAQQSANAYARAARIQAQIDKMMLTA